MHILPKRERFKAHAKNTDRIVRMTIIQKIDLTLGILEYPIAPFVYFSSMITMLEIISPKPIVIRAK